MFVTGPYTIDWTTQLITVADTEDGSLSQAVFDALRLAEDTNEGIQYGQIVEGSGKTDLTPGVATSIDAKLLENWKILSAKISGDFVVEGGNTVHHINGAKIFAANPLVNQSNILAQNGVSVEGLDAAQANAILTEIKKLILARKITRRSTDPANLPGTLSLYDPDTLDLMGEADVYEDEEQATGYRGKGIDWQDRVT